MKTGINYFIDLDIHALSTQAPAGPTAVTNFVTPEPAPPEPPAPVKRPFPWWILIALAVGYYNFK